MTHEEKLNELLNNQPEDLTRDDIGKLQEYFKFYLKQSNDLFENVRWNEAVQEYSIGQIKYLFMQMENNIEIKLD